VSAAAVLPLVPAVPWCRMPQRRDHLCGKGLTPGDKEVWNQANYDVQLCGEGTTVSRIAKFSELTERVVSQSLGKLVRLGLLIAEPRPGKATIYRLPFEYLGVKSAPAPLRENRGGTPEQNRGGSAVRINNARASNTERNTETTTTEREPSNESVQPKSAVVVSSWKTKPAGNLPAPEPIPLPGPIARELMEYGFDHKTAVALAKRPLERIKLAIAYYLRRARDVSNPPGFIRSAIEEEWPLHAGLPAPPEPRITCWDGGWVYAVDVLPEE
jgi:hypothetical protein